MSRVFAVVSCLLTVGAVSWQAEAQPRRTTRRPSQPSRVAVDRACVPGVQTRCDCASGHGVQVCNQAGTGYGACSCGESTREVVMPSRGGSDPGMPGFDPVAVRSQRNWYGWQVLLVDLGSLVLNVAALSSESTGLWYASAGLQLLGPPIVHWAHGRVGAGFGSMGLRLGLPLLGGLAAAGSAGDGDLSPFIIGAGVGGLVAAVLDIALLSTETRGVSANRAASSGVRWALGASPLPGGVQLGVGGAF